MDRTVFIIDGFNLYHSARDAQRDLNGKSTKWLDIDSLCRSCLSAVSPTAKLSGIYYFSALATHLEPAKPDTVKRHKLYIECLKSTGIVVQLSRFKPCTIRRKVTNDTSEIFIKLTRHEEKETDVALAVKLFELFFRDMCDTAVIVTGDTDLFPAVETAKRLFPKKKLYLLSLIKEDKTS